MTPRLRFALTLFATLIGLSVLLLYTTLVEDVLFKGVAFCNADSIQLTFKILGIGSAGLITGFLTSLLVLQDNYYPNLVLSVAVLAKVLFFVGYEAHPSPFWYDLLLSTTLLSGLWMGYYGGIKFPLSPA